MTGNISRQMQWIRLEPQAERMRTIGELFYLSEPSSPLNFNEKYCDIFIFSQILHSYRS
jgi:hypothetical protein